jgi:CRP/FNR family transcriptional regulator, cyclic AMP receptor protein
VVYEQHSPHGVRRRGGSLSRAQPVTASHEIVIRQKIGQNDLAAMAGIARENVTRVLSNWQRHKIMSRLSGYYCVENKAQLEHQAKL